MQSGALRRGAIDTQNIHFRTVKAQLFQSLAHRLAFRMAFNIGIKLRRQKTVGLIALKLGHIDLIGGKAAQRFIKRGGHIAHTENETGHDIFFIRPDEENVMTSFIFRVRNVPAALYKALGGFATNKVNMTKLESYQPNGFLATQFYADIEGHPESEPVRQALEELSFYCSEMDILGVYRAAPERAALQDS